MNKLINKLKEELEQENKSLVDFNRCLNLLEDIQDEIVMIESESQERLKTWKMNQMNIKHQKKEKFKH